MKMKKEYLILAILIIGLSFYLVFHKRDRTQYELPVLQELPASEITKIEISKPEGSVIALERKNDGWVLLPEGYPAETGKISVILESIEKVTLTALVSEAQSYERYGLGKEEKIGVKAWAGAKVKRDFEVGKAASSNQHTFVMVAGDGRVFHARENLRGRFDQTVDDLRDKSVLKFEPSEVEEIELNDAKRTVRLVRKPIPVEVSTSGGKEPSTGQASMVWESSEGTADETKVTQLLSALSSLKCRAYIYDRKKGDFKDPVYTVTMKGLEVQMLSLFSKDEKNENNHPGVSSWNDSPFLISEPQAKQIMLSLDHILKKPQKSE